MHLRNHSFGLITLLLFAGGVASWTGNVRHTDHPTRASMPAPDDPPLPFISPVVAATAFNCVKDTTPFYLRGATGAGQAQVLSSYSQLVLASDMKQKLDNISSPGDTVGVVLYYGMDDPGFTGVPQVVFGLELVELVHKGEYHLGRYYQAEPVANGFHHLVNKRMVPTDRTNWIAQYQQNHKSWMRIRRTNQNSTWDPFTAGTDVETYTFRYQGGIKDLIDHNTDIEDIAIHALAEPMLRRVLAPNDYEETGWRQIVCLVAMDDALQPLLTDTPNQLQLENRALDIGSPCPPLCNGGGNVFLERGQPGHPSCK